MIIDDENEIIIDGEDETIIGDEDGWNNNQW